MHFSRDDKFFSASRVTGPTHNLLQIRLSKDAAPILDCERLPPQGSCVHAPLDEAKVVAAVLEGIAIANKELGADYAVTHIRYVENDTPPEAVYALLARSIIQRIESQEEEHMSTTYRCPICGVELRAHLRYPRYVCRDCADKACSADGRPLAFFNASLGGGFLAQYADTGEKYPSHECYINGVKCWADEAYFGGIVIEVSEAR